MAQLTTPLERPLSRRLNVVIIGGGFAGINAARSMAHLPVNITLIDRRNHHLFQPLLYQVAMAVLSPADIAEPIRTVLRQQKNVQVVMDEATGIDSAKREVALGSGVVLDYDYLVLATGSTHSYFGKDEWAPYAPGLKTIEDAVEIRRRVLLAFELAERQMIEQGSHPPLNFVVIGGGPTGIELAGAIADISQMYMRKDFRHIDPRKAKVTIIEGSPRVLGVYPEDLSDSALHQLNRLHVEVLTGNHVTEIGPGYVVVGGKRIDAVVTLWAAGVQISPLGKMLGAPTDRRGGVIVDDQLNPEGLPNVFVCGDVAHFEQDGSQVPGVAQPAMQMGRHSAAVIEADVQGKPRPSFRYFDKGDMATIGRLAAVARIKWPVKMHLSGLPAWLSWLLIHVIFLVSFRNKVAVFWQWGWNYIAFRRAARLITGKTDLVGWENQPKE